MDEGDIEITKNYHLSSCRAAVVHRYPVESQPHRAGKDCTGFAAEGRMSALTIKTEGHPDVMADSAGRVTISIPYHVRKRSGRKLVQLPSGETLTPQQLQAEPTPLQQALVRGHRWLAMLESGAVKNLSEIALREGVDNSYISPLAGWST